MPDSHARLRNGCKVFDELQTEFNTTIGDRETPTVGFSLKRVDRNGSDFWRMPASANFSAAPIGEFLEAMESRYIERRDALLKIEAEERAREDAFQAKFFYYKGQAMDEPQVGERERWRWLRLLAGVGRGWSD
jgi:hypothetical protein